MNETIRRFAEGLARTTTRRGLFSRGANVAFGALAGAAAGTVLRPDAVTAGAGTRCVFPGPPCPCTGCQSNGVCAKPCLINTTWYASGCWVTSAGGEPVTCCDCTCPNFGTCGCGTDFHNEVSNCPEGTA